MTPSDVKERLVFFPCNGEYLAGVLTVPNEPNGRTVLIPWGAGVYPSSGRNRVRTRLARTLADVGFHAFRFDYRGVGESDGNYRKPSLAAPAVEEIVAASDWLGSQGLSRILVVAHCFGGWSSLMAAPQIAGLEGMAVVSAPVRRDHKQMQTAGRSWRWWATRLKSLNLAKLRSAQHRAVYVKLAKSQVSSFVHSRLSSPKASGQGAGSGTRFSRAMSYLLDRQIPVLLLYGEDDFRADLESELDQGLHQAIEDAGASTQVVTLPAKLGLASLAAQDIVIERVVAWLTTEWVRTSAPHTSE